MSYEFASGIGGSSARARWRHHSERTHCVGRSGSQAMAGGHRRTNADRENGWVRGIRGGGAGIHRRREATSPECIQGGLGQARRGACVGGSWRCRMSGNGSVAIGDPLPRVDGRAKVTGSAKYSAEFPIPGLVYGSLVMSTIASGRVVRMDTAAAEQRARCSGGDHTGECHPACRSRAANIPSARRSGVLSKSADRNRAGGDIRAGEVRSFAGEAAVPAWSGQARFSWRLSELVPFLAQRRAGRPELGRCGCRPGGRRSEDRRGLYHADPASQPDGAARDHRPMEWRPRHPA